MSARERADKKKDAGNGYFKNGQNDLAIKAYSEAIDLDPSHHVYFSNRSAAYLAMKKFKEAACDAEECVRLNPQFIKGYHRLALAQNGLKQYIQAMDTLKKGQKIDFNNKDLHKLVSEIEPLAIKQEQSSRSSLPIAEQLKLRGNDAFKQAQFDKAIELYTEAIKASPEKSGEVVMSCYNNRAACYQQVSNYQAVIEDCTAVLQHQPDNQKALLRRGLAYEGLERYRLALQDIRHLLSINPNVDTANKAQHRIGAAVRMLKKQSGGC